MTSPCDGGYLKHCALTTRMRGGQLASNQTNYEET
jgi:hypothetical protein